MERNAWRRTNFSADVEMVEDHELFRARDLEGPGERVEHPEQQPYRLADGHPEHALLSRIVLAVRAAASGAEPRRLLLAI